MPMYDRQCENGHQKLNCWESMSAADPVCDCGETLKRVLLPARANNILPDDIPGGVWIFNGLCNPDGSPRKYYSRSEIHRAEQEKGLTNIVEHRADPRTGSDKSPYTTSWIGSADTTNYDDPQVREQRRRDMASWLGVSLEEYDRITGLAGFAVPGDLRDAATDVIAREVGLAEAHGLSDSSPVADVKVYVDNRYSR